MSEPKRWTFRDPKTKTRHTVAAETWFFARQAACVSLRCMPDEIETIVPFQITPASLAKLFQGIEHFATGLTKSFDTKVSMDGLKRYSIPRTDVSIVVGPGTEYVGK